MFLFYFLVNELLHFMPYLLCNDPFLLLRHLCQIHHRKLVFEAIRLISYFIHVMREVNPLEGVFVGGLCRLDCWLLYFDFEICIRFDLRD